MNCLNMFDKFISQILALFFHKFVYITGIFLWVFYLTRLIWGVISWPWVFVSLSETLLITLFLEEWKVVCFIQVFLYVLWSIDLTESHSHILHSKMSFWTFNFAFSSKCHLRLTFSHQIQSWIRLILISLIISSSGLTWSKNFRISFLSDEIVKSFLFLLIILQI